MAGVLKRTTGLTGLVVSKRSNVDLYEIYDRILRLAKLLPENYVYRKSLENMVAERHTILKQHTDIATIEAKIGQGKMEELIFQAKREFNMLQSFIQEYKPWEDLMQEPPPHQWTWPPHN
ncbi:unnamed protein product [Xylocopa violacea]|uniref:NADH dehydrogenase [ubiquinone] 1 alpha subcomplex subunit 5 n=1 Tax=Xylocopa violacea TaxID=135666 RepID=A0ABP1PCE0_XYLVO